MPTRLIIAPAVEPIVLADAKLHLRVEHSADDALITAMIAAARQAAEQETGRALITQTRELVLDVFPEAFELGWCPVQSIVSLKYIDADGNEQTLDSAGYTLDNVSAPAWVVPAWGYTWPEPRAVPNAVKVQYLAGYGAAGSAVPEAIRQWMLLQIAAMYENRQAVGAVQTYALPYADRLLDRYRVITLG